MVGGALTGLIGTRRHHTPPTPHGNGKQPKLWSAWAVVGAAAVLCGVSPFPRHGLSAVDAACLVEPDTATGHATVPTSVTSITAPAGTPAFSCCSVNAFSDCVTALQTISLPNTLRAIDDFAFAGARSLRTITIPNSVTSLGTDIFHACSSLQTIVMGSGVSVVPASFAEGCSRLSSVTLPPQATAVSTNAFMGCRDLRSITFPSTVTTFGTSVFESSGVQSLVIPAAVTSIPLRFCRLCQSLLSVVLPSGVQTLGGRAFHQCQSVNNVVIPSSVTTYASQVFRGCDSLRDLEILSSATFDATVFVGNPCPESLYTPLARLCNCSACPASVSPTSPGPTAAPVASTASPVEPITRPITVAPTSLPTTQSPTSQSPTSQSPSSRSPTVAGPTVRPSDVPTVAPTATPTGAPTTTNPTVQPSLAPVTATPTSFAPTLTPTSAPSAGGAGGTGASGSDGGGGGGGSLVILVIVITVVLVCCFAFAVYLARRKRQPKPRANAPVINQGGPGTMNPVFHTTLRTPGRGMGPGKVTVPPNGADYSTPYQQSPRGSPADYEYGFGQQNEGVATTGAGVALDEDCYVAPPPPHVSKAWASPHGTAADAGGSPGKGTLRKDAAGNIYASPESMGSRGSAGNVAEYEYGTPAAIQAGRSDDGAAADYEYGVPVPIGNRPAFENPDYDDEYGMPELPAKPHQPQGQGPVLDEDCYVAHTSAEVSLVAATEL